MYRYNKKIKWENVLLALIAIISIAFYLDGQRLNRENRMLKLSNQSYAQTNERLADELTSAKEHLRAYELRISALNEELKLHK